MAYTVRPDLWPLGMFARIAGGPAGEGIRLASCRSSFMEAKLALAVAVSKGYADPGTLEAHVLAGAEVWVLGVDKPDRPDLRGDRPGWWAGL